MVQIAKVGDIIPYIISTHSCLEPSKYCQTYIASISNVQGDSNK